MPTVVGVRFKPVTKIYYFLPLADSSHKVGDPVIIETSRGRELGWIAMEAKEILDKEVKGTLKPVVRKATPLDLMKMEKYRALEATALEKCKDKVAEMKLPLKMLQAEYSYDGSKLAFSFSSEQRIDFRDLVRVLTRSFRAKVEMRQIGARDEAKVIGGFGRCGRPLCCSSWLTEFHPVSIRMAKNQHLPLAPAEISGVCGRLLCCLAYEDKLYTETRKSLPKIGTEVETPDGKGKVIGLNVLKETAIVIGEAGSKLEFLGSELNVISAPPTSQSPRKRNPRKKKSRSRKKKTE